MLHVPIILSGRKPNLSRIDRLEPQRVEPTFAGGAPSGSSGVEGATRATSQFSQVRNRQVRRGKRFRAASARSRRRLCVRVPARFPRPACGRVPGRAEFGCGPSTRQPYRSGRTLSARVAGRDAPGRGARVAGPGSHARFHSRPDARLDARVGNAHRRSAAEWSGLWSSTVRLAGRGNRRVGTAPVCGGSGL